MKRQIVTIVEGAQGSGKTYAVVQHLCDEFLREEDGKLYTNIELFIEPIAAEVHRRSGGEKSLDSIRERIVLLDVDYVNALKTDVIDGGVTPLTLLPQGKLSSGCLVVLDEVHYFAGPNKSPQHLAEWSLWLGELRKDGMSAYLITPSRDNIATEVTNLAFGLWMAIGVDELRDPWFKVPLRVWYQFEAKLRGSYRGAVEFRYHIKEGKRWVEKHRDPVRRMVDGPQGFDLYNSFSARQGQTEGGTRPKEEWEKRSWPRLIAWAIYHNPGFIDKPARALGLLMLFGGGLWYFGLLDRVIGVQTPGRASKPDMVEVGDPRVDQIKATQRAQTEELRELRKEFAQALDEVRANGEEIAGFVGDRFQDGKGFWHVLGDSWVGSVVTHVDADLGVVRLQDGRTFALRAISPPDSGIVGSAASAIFGGGSDARRDAQRRGNATGFPAGGSQPANVGSSRSRSNGGQTPRDTPGGSDAVVGSP